MPHYDVSNAEILVYSYKAGLLARLAHDLKIQVTAFDIVVDEDGSALQAQVDAASLRVVCAMKDGQPRLRTLSVKDIREIEANLCSDVLRPERFPVIRFHSQRIEATRIQGELELCGQRRVVQVPLRQEGDTRVAELHIDQRQFGITPFKGLAGALKIKPELRVEVRVPVGPLPEARS